MKRILLVLITSYQKLISPLLIPRCRFYPSCSNYAKDAIELNGPLIGITQTIKRLSRCHPFSQGGIDFATKKGANQ
ncbi:MAG: membrane protein insertion efficiency factor YidD [Candidatus Marinamargulisbacteria bacterium]